MKKFFTTLFLLAVICATLAYIFGYAVAHGNDRQQLAKYPWARTIFRLHFDGDARADYLGSRYPQILVEMDVMKGEDLTNSAAQDFADKVTVVTGKPVQLYYSDTIPYEQSVSADDIDHIARQYANGQASGMAYLHVLLLTKKEDETTLLGITHGENTIVLFTEALKTFTARSSSTLPTYEESTLLHEFGHQLGLDHNDNPGCLMNPKAEKDDEPRFRAEDVVTDFCPYEKDLIRANAK